MTRLFSCWFTLCAAACLAVSVWGCNPKIGDECSTSTDCSVNGDRLCDTQQPGGYCTVFNCEPDTCPDEAQCVAFDTKLDPACDDQRWARFERTFCMRRCNNDGDCRSEYACVDVDLNAGPNSWGARVADLEPEGTKICIAPYSNAPSSGSSTDVCRPLDGGFPDGYLENSPDAQTQDADQDVEDGTSDADQDVEDGTSDADQDVEDGASDDADAEDGA